MSSNAEEAIIRSFRLDHLFFKMKKSIENSI